MFCLSVLEQGSRSSSRSSSPSVRMPPPEKTCSRAYFSPEDPTGTPAPVLPGSLSSSPDVSSQSCRLLLTQHLFQTVLSRLYLVFWGDGLLLKQPDTLRRSGKLCWSSCSNSLFLLRHQRLRQLHSHGVSHPGSPAAGRPAHVHVRLHVCLYRWTVYRSQDQSNEPIELRLTCVSMSVARHLVNVLSRPGLQCVGTVSRRVSLSSRLDCLCLLCAGQQSFLSPSSLSLLVRTPKSPWLCLSSTARWRRST